MEYFIKLDVEGETKHDVISNLSNELYANGKLSDANSFIDAVKAREKEYTTGFENGIAIPHGKADSVQESSFILGKLKNKVDWQSMDGQAVDLVFLLAISTKESGETHIRLLSKIAVSIMEEDFVDRLRNAKSESEMELILEQGLGKEETR